MYVRSQTYLHLSNSPISDGDIVHGGKWKVELNSSVVDHHGKQAGYGKSYRRTSQKTGLRK